MTRRVLRVLFPALACVLFLSLSCSEEKTTEPLYEVISMWGALDLPEGADLEPAELTIGFGDHDQAVSDSASFGIQGNEGVPGLAIAYDQNSVPILLKVVPDPQQGAYLDLNVHSSALALAFLCPFVCVSDPADAAEVLALLEQLPELATFEDALNEALEEDIRCLESENPDLDALLGEVVTSYLNTYPEQAARHYPSLVTPVPGGSGAAGPDAGSPSVAAASTDAGEVVIEPGHIVSGHQIQHTEADDFTISNYRGRWAICRTPTEELWIFPNGTLLDALKGKPWAPSSRKFQVSVTPGGEAKTVGVYGLGWQDDSDNLWANLTSDEKSLAANAGVATILVEFVPHVISVVTNCSKGLGSGAIAQQHVVKMVSTFFKFEKGSARAYLYIEKGDYWGLAWYVAKEAIKQVALNDEFKSAFVAALGMQLTEGAIKKLACMCFPAVAGVIIGDSATSVAKTYLGMVNSRFKTEFTIHRELIQEFGAVQGSVHDKADGRPIEGAVVDLLGDDANPLNPSHHDVTSADGGFYFENIMVGSKTLQVTKVGYTSKSVPVTVEEDKTATALIELAKVGGSSQGRILDDILIRHGVTPANIRKSVDLTAQEIGGEHRSYSYWVDNGAYTLSLSVGTWWLKASHEDYFPDSTQVTVNSLGQMSAPADLILKPRSVIQGTIYVDMDNNGHYETTYSFDGAQLAGAAVQQAEWPCLDGSSAGQVIQMMGRDAREGAANMVLVELDPVLAGEPGLYNLGGMEDVACGKAAGTVIFQTERLKCTYPDVGQFPMVFSLTADPEFLACNCGITGTARGTAYLSDVGVQLTDLVAGSIDGATLAGWKGCECSCCEDLDGDGEEDDWIVDCARAYVSLEFRFLVGSLTNSGMAQQLRRPAQRRN